MKNMKIRRSGERGHFNHGWLESYHTFSFADYHNPKHMNFRSLRVINEDHVAPGQGFGAHPHRDMEIITYLIDGSLRHEDNMGNGSVIKPGDIQKMSAGTGVVHSEFNASKETSAHLLQIWILPDTKGLKPSYEQISKADLTKSENLTLIGAKTKQAGIISIHQDVRLYYASPKKGKKYLFEIEPSRALWIQMIRGEIGIHSESIRPGDGVAVEGEKTVEINAGKDSEFLLFDLA